MWRASRLEISPNPLTWRSRVHLFLFTVPPGQSLLPYGLMSLVHCMIVTQDDVGGGYVWANLDGIAVYPTYSPPPTLSCMPLSH